MTALEFTSAARWSSRIRLRAAASSITLTAKAGVTLNPQSVTIQPGSTTANFAAVAGPGVTGPCSIIATADSGSTRTSSFTAVAFTRIESADGRPLPDVVALRVVATRCTS